MILAGTYLGKHASKGLRFSIPNPSDQKNVIFPQIPYEVVIVGGIMLNSVILFFLKHDEILKIVVIHLISVINFFPLPLVEVCCIIIQGNFHTQLFSFCVCVQFVSVATMRLNPAIFNICNLLFPYDEICVLVACSVVVDGRINLTIL